MKTLEDIVVIYHANCQDGFGAAYAAWKKFGDQAAYCPSKVQDSVPPGLNDKEVYILDYSYDQATLEELRKRNRKVVVIDHHQSAKEAVTTFSENVFDDSHSGAVLAWQYFHHNSPAPKLLQHIEDSDLWAFKLPETKSVVAHLWQHVREFAVWDQLFTDLEDPQEFRKFVEKGDFILEQKQKYVQELLTYKASVEFAGHQSLAVNCARPYRSDVGNALAEETGTFGIVWYHYEGAWHISMRSVGDFDVSKLAEQYGGGGHKNAASVRFTEFADIPMKFL